MQETSSADLHPFVAALPPATDYVAYLMLIEYNLKREDLGLLNDLLHDEKLTVNIGWDLVLILLPFLPDSASCLHTIARLGNPREVVLKVTEALRIIEWQSESSDINDDDSEDAVIGDNDAPVNDGAVSADAKQALQSAQLRLAAHQFIVLVDMLSTLHLRIKTKYPSRFASTSLQAVLAAFNEVPSDLDLLPLVNSMIKLVRTLRGSRRPALPPRQSTGNIAQATDGSLPAGSDPEAQAGSVSASEKAIQNRLLQSFVTHVVERSFTIFGSATDKDMPGLMLSGQVFEKSFPQKTVPGRKTWSEKATSLSGRESVVSTSRLLEQLSQNVGLSNQDLISAAIESSTPVPDVEATEEEPPTSSNDVPLSPSGSLCLLASRITREQLEGVTRPQDVIKIFPDQANAIKQIIGTEEAGGMATAGTEAEGSIDAVLALGLIALENNEIGEPGSDEMFMQYLQTISLLSANSPSPSLRFHAHVLTTTVLRSHPSDELRLTFIRDTLEHCPYDNLKVSAVSWIKGETIEANPVDAPRNAGGPRSIFASPVALQSLASFLFEMRSTKDLVSRHLVEAWTTFKTRLSFYLASMNFYYLLLTAKHLREPLQVASLHHKYDIGGGMIHILRGMSKMYRKCLGDEVLQREEGPHGVQHAMLDLDILDDVLSRVEQGVVDLNIKQ